MSAGELLSSSKSQSIAIDGPVASGKTTVGEMVATKLGWRFLDTGAMYRAVTWAVLGNGVDVQDLQAVTELAMGLDIRVVADATGDRMIVDGQDITNHLRVPEVDRTVSAVSAIPGVRRELVSIQRKIAEDGPIVMVGRDIGTVVLPDAGTKIYLQASVEVRAQRRFAEMQSKGGSAPEYQSVVDDLNMRDKVDTEREDSPLKSASDAIQIDTDNLVLDAVVAQILTCAGTA